MQLSYWEAIQDIIKAGGSEQMAGIYVLRNKAGLVHRVGGPAFVSKDLQMWYLNGVRHRIGGPAAIYTPADGSYSEDWCEHGELHRIDGPARTLFDGKQEWWIRGIRKK